MTAWVSQGREKQRAKNKKETEGKEKEEREKKYETLDLQGKNINDRNMREE